MSSGHVDFVARSCLDFGMAIRTITKGQQLLREGASNLKVREVASRLGIEESYASRLLSGERLPGAALRTKILEQFGIRPETFEEVIRKSRRQPRARRVIGAAPEGLLAAGGAR